MPQVPAGYLADNTPLTGMEAALLVSVNGWAKDNSSWYNSRTKIVISFYMSLVIFFLGLFIEVLFFIGLLFAIASGFLLKNAKPTAMKFAKFGGTTHSIIDWDGNFHFITKNPKLHSNFTVREGITRRKRHNPDEYFNPDPWANGDDEFHRLSLSSFEEFIVSENNNLQMISGSKSHQQRVSILDEADSRDLLKYVIPYFHESHFGEDIQHFSKQVDIAQYNDSRASLDWIKGTINHNVNSISSSLSEIYAEKEEYSDWLNHIKSRCEQLSAISFDSNIQGWNKSLVGLFDTERSLEQSVAADVIAQEESVKREMEQAESRLREKKSDFELQLAEKHETLSRNSAEIDGMIAAQIQTIANIQSLTPSPTITLESKYGVASGGGGVVGSSGGRISAVHTTIQSHFYDIVNPAYPVLQGVEQIASGELNRYKAMKQAVQNEIEELSGAFNRRNEQMRKQQEERLKEIEMAKERAISAIRKDSTEVLSIQYCDGDSDVNPWSTLNRINNLSWLRPYVIVLNLMERYNEIESKFESLEVEINQETNFIYSKLSKNNAGDYQVPKFNHHWVVIGDNAFSEIICSDMIDFDYSSKVQIERGSTYEQLGIEPEDIIPQHISSTNITSCLYKLMLRGAVSPNVYQSITRFSKSTLRGVSNV